MNTLISRQTFSDGSKVAFKGEMVKTFIQETSGDGENHRRYQQIVLGGLDQIGEVNGWLENLINVTYPDGWTVPIHPKYLKVLPPAEG